MIITIVNVEAAMQRMVNPSANQTMRSQGGLVFWCLLAVLAVGAPSHAADKAPSTDLEESEEDDSADFPTSVPSTSQISTNRTWDVLVPPKANATWDDYRPVIRRAGELFGDWRINVAGVRIDGPRLLELADGEPQEPFLRRVREVLRRPFDLEDFALFLDDVLAAGERGLRGHLVWVTAGRARNAGITLHPDEVFFKKTRRYGEAPSLNIDKPARPAQLEPANDGDVLGPNWTARFRNPGTTKQMLAALEEENTSGTYAERIRSLRHQLKAQGADFYVYSSTRNRSRGYLMWGAFALSRAKTAGEVRSLVRKLEQRNREWGLNVPIRWKHPNGWRATIAAAREMAETYDVVYATENGARNSNHYGGQAVDIGVLGLPRTLVLEAPDGEKATFDCSDPEHPRDLNLAPEIIDWIEAHFQMKKLRSDYPHWSDAAPPRQAAASASAP